MVRGMIKPMVFLATEPIVQIFALYMAVLYGVLYITMTSMSILTVSSIGRTHLPRAFVRVYTDQYGQSTGVAGLHYLAVLLGSTGSQSLCVDISCS
jgi:hypothetical protein